MKKLLLPLFILAVSLQSFAQDPELVNKTWYLEYLTIDGQDHIPPFDEYVPNIPTTFDPFGGIFSFGTYVCNSLNGDVTYSGSNQFSLSHLSYTLLSCDGFSDLYEWMYFEFYIGNKTAPFNYTIIDEGAGGMRLVIEANNSDLAYYGNDILASGNFELNKLVVLPNPASDILYIASEGISIENLSVYAISGQQLMSQSGNTNAIDVSALSEGIYFIEIRTENGRQLQKFIKK